MNEQEYIQSLLDEEARLDAELAQTSDEQSDSGLDWGIAGVGAVDVPTFGFGAKGIAGIQAVKDALAGDISIADIPERYRLWNKVAQEKIAEAPGSYLAGTASGLALPIVGQVGAAGRAVKTAPMAARALELYGGMGSIGKLSELAKGSKLGLAASKEGAPLMTRVGSALLNTGAMGAEGAIMGGLYGAGSSADNPILDDIAEGAAAGGALGVAGKALMGTAGAVVPMARKAKRGLFSKAETLANEEAARLEQASQGVVGSRTVGGKEIPYLAMPASEQQKIIRELVPDTDYGNKYLLSEKGTNLAGTQDVAELRTNIVRAGSEGGKAKAYSERDAAMKALEKKAGPMKKESPSDEAYSRYISGKSQSDEAKVVNSLIKDWSSMTRGKDGKMVGRITDVKGLVEFRDRAYATVGSAPAHLKGVAQAVGDAAEKSIDSLRSNPKTASLVEQYERKADAARKMYQNEGIGGQITEKAAGGTYADKVPRKTILSSKQAAEQWVAKAGGAEQATLRAEETYQVMKMSPKARKSYLIAKEKEHQVIMGNKEPYKAWRKAMEGDDGTTSGWIANHASAMLSRAMGRIGPKLLGGALGAVAGGGTAYGAGADLSGMLTGMAVGGLVGSAQLNKLKKAEAMTLALIREAESDPKLAKALLSAPTAASKAAAENALVKLIKESEGLYGTSKKIAGVAGRDLEGGSDEKKKTELSPATPPPSPKVVSMKRVSGKDIYKAIEKAESAGNPKAVSPKGAMGAMQLMPATFNEWKIRLNMPDADPLNREDNIKIGTAYFNHLKDRYDGDTKLALAAYNYGLGRIDKLVAKHGANYEALEAKLPKETKDYVPRVLSYLV